MGVSTHYYVVYGIRHEYHEEFSEAYDEVYNDHDVPFVVIDGMGGEYTIIGTLLFDSGDLRYSNIKDELTITEVSSLQELERQYKEKFVAKFPKFSHLVEDEFKIITVAHYS